MNSEDNQLQTLLRESRAASSLPPRFQQNVWHRIEDADVPVKSGETTPWLEALVTLMLRPRFACATVAVLMLGGILLGAHNGVQTARQDAQARYVASVAPNPLP